MPNIRNMLSTLQPVDPEKHHWLVVYLPLPKNMKVIWDDYSQYMEK